MKEGKKMQKQDYAFMVNEEAFIHHLYAKHTRLLQRNDRIREKSVVCRTIKEFKDKVYDSFGRLTKDVALQKVLSPTEKYRIEKFRNLVHTQTKKERQQGSSVIEVYDVPKAMEMFQKKYGSDISKANQAFNVAQQIDMSIQMFNLKGSVETVRDCLMHKGESPKDWMIDCTNREAKEAQNFLVDVANNCVYKMLVKEKDIPLEIKKEEVEKEKPKKTRAIGFVLKPKKKEAKQKNWIEM